MIASHKQTLTIALLCDGKKITSLCDSNKLGLDLVLHYIESK